MCICVLCLKGIVAFLGILRGIKLEDSSIPKESGVTSTNTISSISPLTIPPCIAALEATDSFGSIEIKGSL